MPMLRKCFFQLTPIKSTQLLKFYQNPMIAQMVEVQSRYMTSMGSAPNQCHTSLLFKSGIIMKVVGTPISGVGVPVV